jgi:DNA-binding winged helix-turn-helix (wHTH) protein/Tol biopolymer transport system component
MQQFQNNGRLLKFGVFELDVESRELRKSGMRLKLAGQPLQVLEVLVLRSGEVVSKEELRQQIWGDNTFVDHELALKKAVNRIRVVLGDSAENPRFIETLPRHGYRFLLAVSGNGTSQTALSEPAGMQSRILGISQSSSVAESPGSLPRPAEVRDFLGRSRLRNLTIGLLAAFAALVIAWAALRHPNAAGPLIAEQLITANPAEAPVTGAIVSPDGKSVAYSDTTGIYLRQIETGETHSLQLPKGLDAVPASWFPDSMHLLLGSRPVAAEPPNLWTVSILGGKPKCVLENASDGAVSPDGLKIAFLRGNVDAREVWVSKIDGSGAARLAIIELPENGRSNDQHWNSKRDYAGMFISQPTWSATGKRIAYIRGFWEGAPNPAEESYSLVETVDANGGPAKPAERSALLLPALYWAADGRIFYAHQTNKASERGDYGVWEVKVNPDSGEIEQSPRQLTSGVGRIGGITVAADSKRIVLWRANAHPQGFLAEVDHLTRQLKIVRRITLDENANVVSTWTPDSRAVLFVSNRSGTWKLFRQAIDQVAPDVLANGPNIFLPRLSPDGSKVMYLTGYDANLPTRAVQLMQVPLRGGAPQMLLQKPSIINIQCARSPSQLCLLTTLVGGSAKFFSFDSQNGENRELFSYQVTDNLNWSLSADGLQLAMNLPPGAPTISFMSLKDQKVHRVQVKGSARISALDWAGDNRNVFAAGVTTGGIPAIWDVESGGNSRIVLDGDRQTHFWWALPSPDGRYIALEKVIGENNVRMAEKF